METKKLKLQKKEVADFQKFSEINFLRTLIAFLNTDGGIIRISNKEETINESFIFNVLRENRGRLPHWLISFGLNRDIDLFSNSIFLQSTTIDNTPFFIIEVDKIRSEKGFYYLLNDDGGKDYYFRVKGKNVKTDEKDAFYWEKIALYDAPVYKDYGSDNEDLSNHFEEIRNKIVIQSIGKMTRNTYVYKYMDLEAAIQCLENKNIRFYEPTNWDDQYEGRFYNAEFYDSQGNLHNSNLTPFLYATCLSTQQENEAAWVLYSHNKKGLAARCVEFRIDIKKLIDQIAKHVIDELSNGKGKMSVYLGRVEYLSKFDVDNLHHQYVGKSKVSNNNYHKYFDNFSLKCYLNLLLLKRVAFEHEKELRVFLIPEVGLSKTRRISKKNFSREGKTGEEIKPLHTSVNLDWGELINEVRYDEKCSEYELTLLKRAIQGINPDIPLEPYNPYEDKSMRTGAISIKTNCNIVDYHGQREQI